MIGYNESLRLSGEIAGAVLPALAPAQLSTGQMAGIARLLAQGAAALADDVAAGAVIVAAAESDR